MGSKRKWVIDWPDVPNVWPILSGTNLTQEETLLLQDVGFRLQDRPLLSPRRLFHMSKVFKTNLFDKQRTQNPNAYPTVRNNKAIRRLGNALTPDQRNKWESVSNVKGEIWKVTLLPSPGIEAIVSLEMGWSTTKMFTTLQWECFLLVLALILLIWLYPPLEGVNST